MNRRELIERIKEKQEYSELTEKDVVFALEKFDKDPYSDEEKIKLTRKFLMENYSGFASRKLLTKKGAKPGWILKKHLSTRERVPYYGEIYGRILKGMKEEVSIIDLGSGVNGFSYPLLGELGFKVSYVGVESMGQLVREANEFFKKEGYDGKAIHESLLEKEKIFSIVKNMNPPRIILLFKVVDSLESLERNYSKELIECLADLCNKIVVSFSTESMVKREKIWAKRTWFLKFVKEKFNLWDDFEVGGERYFIFSKYEKG